MELKGVCIMITWTFVENLLRVRAEAWDKREELSHQSLSFFIKSKVILAEENRRSVGAGEQPAVFPWPSPHLTSPIQSFQTEKQCVCVCVPDGGLSGIWRNSSKGFLDMQREISELSMMRKLKTKLLCEPLNRHFEVIQSWDPGREEMV